MNVETPAVSGTGMPIRERLRSCEVPFHERYFFDTVQRRRDDAISRSQIVRIRVS
ncbi:hypothetical protein [Bradyrhizobium sp. RDM4]|jgi:hypothetical protein|uniref:hypothetical protein n=1 Tax=Bradyrhizobium sp. RDM4 TaxID=3378765 RepID=UPI0038FC7E99